MPSPATQCTETADEKLAGVWDDFVVERGSQFSRGRVRRYSLIGIPLGATRHQIAYELACLVGLEVVPYTVTALVEEASGRVKGSQRPYRVPTRPIR